MGDGAANAGGLHSMLVTVAWSLQPGEVQERKVDLPAGSTVSAALAAAGVLPACIDGRLQCGIWGRPVDVESPVYNGDRVEAVRALQVDPKEARRMRFQSQGKRSTGLFARRR